MTNPPRDWFFSIGPLDESGVEVVRCAIEAAVDEDLDVTAFSHRELYIGAWEVSAVKSVIAVLAAGLEDNRTSPDDRKVAGGVLSILQMWLKKDYDQVDIEE
jgi:hypothetical protein